MGHSLESSCLTNKLPATMTQSPTDVVNGAESDAEVLRPVSFSTSSQGRDFLLATDPRAAYPAMDLSGRIISATFCIPYSLAYRRGSDWILHKRRGSSALFDSFAYLSSDETQWNHTLVGWTGEITEPADLTPTEGPSTISTTAPTLLNGSTKSGQPAEAADCEGLYISNEDRIRLEVQLVDDKISATVPVWLSDDCENTSEGGLCLKDQARWRRFVEHELYALFHYRQSENSKGQTDIQTWADYQTLNQKFADRILEIYKPGDVVMIHDYHLMLLPSMLRERIPDVYISLFFHVPFPSSEFLRRLPQRKDILQGALGSNLVGFQSYDGLRHFISSCARILQLSSDITGVDYGARVAVGVFPIGINAAATEKKAFDNPIISTKSANLRQRFEGKKIIVGRDRLDTARGVAQKFMAFEKLLEVYPKWREKVVLIQITSSTSVEEATEDSGKKVATKVSELEARINGLYGSLEFSPIEHYPQYISPAEYFALLRAADVALITSIRDGMNTTSLEYVLCQRDSHGPLILSEFSGTASSLKDAIHINPYDLPDVAHQINNALTMSEDKKTAMHASLYLHVTTKNVQAWSNRYIKQLLTVINARQLAATTPLLDKTALFSQYGAATKRLFLFDYDGTLTPIVRDPAAAIPSEKVIRTIKALASDHRNAVWIISGRDQKFLGQHLGDISELGFSAEHGNFMRHPGSTKWENLAETFDMSWQKEVMECFEKYTDRTPGSFVEKKRCALTWHYRPSDPELGAFNAVESQKELQSTVGKAWDVEVMTGKKNVEVRPKSLNKGEIARRLVADYGHEVGEPPEFVLCLGDDATDEDMFHALNGSSLPPEHVFTVSIGASSKSTCAQWYLAEPADVIRSLAILTGEDGDAGDR